MTRRAMRSLTAILLGCAAAVVAQEQPRPSTGPATVPESSDHTRTSSAADVARFVDACVALPHGDRLTVRVAGKSERGRAMLVVRVAPPERTELQAPAKPIPGDGPLRVLVIANIHAGEVEGKEAVQLLLREFANGEHEALLQHCEPWFVPIYNVDGNEAVKLGNRRGQNGPDEVGQRHNANDLDLNRDFVKVDAKETRVLLDLWNRIDPHVFVDLHTTNGSFHGYQLTYAPSLSSNLDAGVDRFGRELLEATRRRLQPLGYQTFDYGNFETRDWDGGGAPDSGSERGWFTYDHRARYGVNCFGLRNRIGVLSEAYSYADFRTRIAATRAFLLALFEELVARREEALRTMRDADTRLADGEAALGYDTHFAPPETLPVLVGDAERVDAGEGRPMRLVQKPGAEPETMRVFRRFTARQRRPLPAAWAIVAPPADFVQRLEWHGIAFRTLEQETAATAERFAVDKKRKPRVPYQGHQELVLDGRWLAAEAQQLPAGTLWIDARQPRARLAAVLLEPQSEDSLSTWNFLEQLTDEHYPVLRVIEN